MNIDPQSVIDIAGKFITIGMGIFLICSVAAMILVSFIDTFWRKDEK